MRELSTIFVSIDPTTNKQLALDRAAAIAKKCAGSKLHAYVCIYSDIETDDQEALKQAEIDRYKLWMENIIAPLRTGGLEVNAIIDWSEDWHHAIGPAAERAGSDLIVKYSRPRTPLKHRLMTSSDFALFKSASCTILTVRSEEHEMAGNVLVAVDCKRESAEYNEILDEALAHGRRASTVTRNGELHVVNAYSTQDDYIHVTDVVKRTGVDAKFVHVVGAEPEQAIARVAEDINAALVIIGLSTKSNLVNRVFGSTAEWLLNNLTQDILVVIP